jgi:hypothetical protein
MHEVKFACIWFKTWFIFHLLLLYLLFSRILTNIYIEIEMCNVGLLRYFSVNLCLHKTKIFSDFF